MATYYYGRTYKGLLHSPYLHLHGLVYHLEQPYLFQYLPMFLRLITLRELRLLISHGQDETNDRMYHLLYPQQELCSLVEDWPT
jgi:hypothetical protein